MTKIRADEIKHALSKRHCDDFFITEVKTGSTWFTEGMLKFDAYAIKKSWTNPCLYGYEIKVSRNDFLQDNKWPGYLPYCNRFSFVCPTGLIKPEELPDEVGLVYYNSEKKTLYTKRAARHRIIEYPNDLFLYIIMNRLDSDRHPFYDNEREEYIKAYLQNRLSKWDLGKKFNSKLVSDLTKAEREIDGLKYEVSRLKRDSEILDRILTIIKEYGIEIWYWNNKWEDELRTLLKSKMPKKMIDLAQEMRNNIDQILELAQAE